MIRRFATLLSVLVGVGLVVVGAVPSATECLTVSNAAGDVVERSCETHSRWQVLSVLQIVAGVVLVAIPARNALRR